MKQYYDIIVIGGGHAGTEASHICSVLGANTLLITNDENTSSPINTIKTTNKGTVFWRLLVNTAEEIDALDVQRRSTVCEYR